MDQLDRLRAVAVLEPVEGPSGQGPARSGVLQDDGDAFRQVAPPEILGGELLVAIDLCDPSRSFSLDVLDDARASPRSRALDQIALGKVVLEEKDRLNVAL